MHISSRIEQEIKLVVDSHNIRQFEEYMTEQGDDVGSLAIEKRHIYYDFDGLDLADIGVSYRKSLKRPSYCLKYPVGEHDSIMVRREILVRSKGFDLDIANTFHRQVPIIAKMLELLNIAGRRNLTNLRSFRPTVLIHCKRTHRPAVKMPTGEYCVGVYFDDVKGFIRGLEAPIVEWREIELEVNDQYPGSGVFAEQLAKQLEARGGVRSKLSKYATVVSYLKQGRRA